MGSRRHISRKASQKSAFTPSPDPFAPRGFANGVKPRSPKLPSTDILQPRPFLPLPEKTSPQEKQVDLQTKLERGELIEQSAANISVFAPGKTPALPIQTKLTIGETGDKYEQEADTVAARVVDRINRPESQETAASETVQWEEIEEEEVRQKPEVETIQREDMLDEGSKMQPKLDDNKTGEDIFFREGQYEPGSRGGQELLAHELTHVVQQNHGVVQRMKVRGTDKLSAVSSATKTKHVVALASQAITAAGNYGDSTFVISEDVLTNAVNANQYDFPEATGEKSGRIDIQANVVIYQYNKTGNPPGGLAKAQPVTLAIDGVSTLCEIGVIKGGDDLLKITHFKKL